MVRVVAFDPGLNVGVALVAADGRLLGVSTVTLAEASGEVPPGTKVLVGDGTGSAELVAALRERGLDPEVVDETGTTLEARQLYWRQNRAPWPLGWLPVALRPLPVSIDGYAAWAIARRWLEARSGR